MPDSLYWDDSYAISLELIHQFPNINLDEVSLEMIYHWTIALPAFADDPALATDDILYDIYQTWLEET